MFHYHAYILKLLFVKCDLKIPLSQLHLNVSRFHLDIRLNIIHSLDNATITRFYTDLR